MKDQTHLTLEKKKKRTSLALWGQKSKTKQNNNNKKKKKREYRGRRRKKTTYSLPSLHERSETPGASDRRNWESQEANPLPRTVLSASVRITGYRRSGCRQGRQESISRYVYGAAQTPTQFMGRRCSEPQSASAHATSNTVCWQIQYLNPSQLNGWRAPADLGYSQSMLTTITSASYR